MKTRTLTLILAALLLLTASAVPAGAQILYDDAFDDFNNEFWDTNTRFYVDDGIIDAWEDAVVLQSHSDWNNPTWGAFDEFTAWVDVFIEDSANEGPYSAGIWYTNIYDKIIGYFDSVERYEVMYCGDTSAVDLKIDSPRRIKGLGEDGVAASMKLEDEPGMNYNGEAVRLGIRVEKGKFSAYANGKLVGEHSYQNIGLGLSPIVLYNSGCHAKYDNFVVGDLSEDVIERTRPYGYVPEVHTVSVEGGKATYPEAVKGESITVEASVPSGKRFERWVLVSGEGIGEEMLAEPSFTFTMPDCDVSLSAVFTDDETAFTPGDVNGDGKVNSKDVVALMKSIVGIEVKGFVAAAADFDKNGRVNAKDVVALMKAIVA